VIAYEIVLMLDPEVEEDRQGELVARARELVEKGGGTWRSHDIWGRRRLAYEIRHKTDAFYHLLVFDAEPATLDELTRILKITDGVMRHLAVRHIEGSRTSAPRDDGPPPPAFHREREDDRGRGYAAANTRSQEEE
jgi:small subunit ribosomal protein S6